MPVFFRLGKRDDAPYAKRQCFSQPVEKSPTTDVQPAHLDNSPCSSPVAPSPEPLSPVLECESSTYRWISCQLKYTMQACVELDSTALLLT